MDKTSQRPQKSNNRKKKILFIVFFLIFIWLIVSNIKIIRTYRESRANNLFAEKSKIELEEDVQSLEEKIDLIKTEQGIEEHIRLKYPLVKDGERVLVINTEDDILSEKETFWTKLSDFIKSIF